MSLCWTLGAPWAIWTVRVPTRRLNPLVTGRAVEGVIHVAVDDIGSAGMAVLVEDHVAVGCRMHAHWLTQMPYVSDMTATLAAVTVGKLVVPISKYGAISPSS